MQKKFKQENTVPFMDYGLLNFFIMEIKTIFNILEKEVIKYNVPIADLIEVETHNPFKVLVGTILSARTRDEITAKVAEDLFRKINSPKDLEKLSLSEIESIIKSINFYKNKARYLKNLPLALKKFNNKIPNEIEELLTLPGVGRKTANLVRSVAFQKPAICVDTHVHKIMNRIGYVKTKNPLQTEIELRKNLPENLWIKTNIIFVSFGQNICTPISPKCSKCPINKLCPKIGVKKSR